MKAVAGGAIAALLFLNANSAGAVPTSPSETLQAVEQAYASGDSTGLRNLFTADYEFLSQEGVELSADKELELVGHAIRIAKCTLSFSRKMDLRCIPTRPRTWVIPHLETKLKVQDKFGTHDVTNWVTLYLIEDKTAGTVRIFRWIEEPTTYEGCD